MVRSFTCEEALIACEEKNLLHWLPPNLRVYPLQIGLETHCPCPILNRRSAYLTTAIYTRLLGSISEGPLDFDPLARLSSTLPTSGLGHFFERSGGPF